jgi:hypothetical protein
MKIRLAGFISSLTIAFAAPALATPLPATSGSTIASIDDLHGSVSGVENNGPTTTSFENNSLGAAFGSTQTVNPSVFASALSSTYGDSIIASARLDYYFEVAGPANTYVPITVIGTVSASGIGNVDGSSIAFETASYYDAATASAAAKAGHPLELNAYACFAQGGCGQGEQTTVILNDTVRVLSNAPIAVELVAFENLNQYNYNAYVTATADPLIQIDQSYADAKDFSLAFSDDIVQTQTTSAVPEPSTWLLMLAGFAILGGRLRARDGLRSLRPGSRRTSANLETGPSFTA